jgi:hypothetical protein
MLYGVIVQMAICNTEIGKIPPNSNDLTRFGYGVVNELASSMDIEAILASLKGVALENLQNRLECLQSLDQRLQTPYQGGSQVQTPKDFLMSLLPCLTGVTGTQLTEMEAMLAALIYHIENEDYGDAYIQGKSTVFVISAILPIFGEIKFAKLLSTLKNTQYASKLTILINQLKGKSFSQMITFLRSGRAFVHNFTSGVVVTRNAKQGTFLIGSFPTDLKIVFLELKYPKMDPVDFSFPVPAGQKFNLLNVSDAQHIYWGNNGGFFTKVNGPWIDAAVAQNADIIVVSDFSTVYKKVIDKETLQEIIEITGFGKEIHRLEWIHGYRFNPTTKMMVSPNNAGGLPTITKFSDN